MIKKSKAREELDKDRNFIFWLFDHRCIWNCGEYTEIIHEVVPISHGKVALAIKNRVPLCSKHHTLAHANMRVSIPFLQERRKQFLVRKFLHEDI